MERGYCHAEQARIADELRLSRATVNRVLDVLVKAKYLQDRTNAKGRARIYVDTGKAGCRNFQNL
jgi:DNA-binding MarR family transcriptional regulator